MAAGLPAPNEPGYVAPDSEHQSGETTFHEFLHALNPLQHLPVIGMIYRAVTGDDIQPAYKIGGSIVAG